MKEIEVRDFLLRLRLTAVEASARWFTATRDWLGHPVHAPAHGTMKIQGPEFHADCRRLNSICVNHRVNRQHAADQPRSGQPIARCICSKLNNHSELEFGWRALPSLAAMLKDFSD